MSRAAPSRSHEPEAPPSSPRSPPRAHRRRSPPRNSAPSPWAAPSQPPLVKLNLPLESPTAARAKPPSLGPGTGPPAASRRQASPAAGFSPRSAGSPAVWPRRRFLPPPLAGKWALKRRRYPRGRAVPPRPWAAAGPKAPQRALAPGVGQKPCPRPSREEFPFLFLFPPFFPFK